MNEYLCTHSEWKTARHFFYYLLYSFKQKCEESTVQPYKSSDTSIHDSLGTFLQCLKGFKRPLYDTLSLYHSYFPSSTIYSEKLAYPLEKFSDHESFLWVSFLSVFHATSLRTFPLFRQPTFYRFVL